VNEQVTAKVVLSLLKVLAEELNQQREQTFLFELNDRRYVLNFLTYPKDGTGGLHDWGPRIAGISAGGGVTFVPRATARARSSGSTTHRQLERFPMTAPITPITMPK
jgi:hypothetical protein